MDAFFASVELLHHPEWRGRPLVVGSGPHERGVVSTCSYEARKFGVRSAMPSRTAYQLCPQAIFTPPNMKLYKRASDEVFEIFSRYTPYVEGVSIDEAYLDITGTIHLYGDARSLGEALRREVKDRCGLTCSVGIAPNRLLAKMGSESCKPNGLAVMPFDADAIARHMRTIPSAAVPGAGKRTVEVLRRYGIATCGDVQRTPLAELVSILGDAAARSLKDAALGIGSDEVHWMPSAELSVSREHTFDEDVTDRETVRAKLLELVVDVGRRFRRERRWARTAKLKIRDSAFNTFTKQMPFDAPARDDISFRERALALFDKTDLKSVRLVGFGVTNIQDSPDDGELSLFAGTDRERPDRRERLSSALDSLRDKGFNV